MEKIKTIDVTAKEWFDKVNGESYFAGTVTINFGMRTEKTFKMPFQYGYGDHYQQMAFKLLQKEGIIPDTWEGGSHWQYYRDNDIIVRNTKHKNCLKRELNNLNK